jgi:hypothetical protein
MCIKGLGSFEENKRTSNWKHLTFRVLTWILHMKKLPTSCIFSWKLHVWKNLTHGVFLEITLHAVLLEHFLEHDACG